MLTVFRSALLPIARGTMASADFWRFNCISLYRLSLCQTFVPWRWDFSSDLPG